MSSLDVLEERVLVSMPSERDAERTLHLLADAGLTSVACTGILDLCRAVREGAGAVLVTDEILSKDCDRQLESALCEQPAWSSLPVLVLAREGSTARVQQGSLGRYNSVVILERPVRTRSLVSALQSALRARRNQYQIREAIREHERQARELKAQDDELAAQADQLRQADRRKDEFLATLAHELRNPLAPISTGLSLLAEAKDPASSKKVLAVVQRQIRHMVRLIDDLLDVSRITTGKLELKREHLSIATVIEAAVEASLPNIQQNQHDLHLDIAAEPLIVDADHTRIAQVISNLLNNASKYTPKGGRIELSARRDGDRVRVAVRDNGLGIPKEHLEDIFEMFGQVNHALDRTHGGLGIGLALVRTLVQMHGGTVEAHSDGLDAGSTFTVTLPLAEASVAAEASAPMRLASVPADKRVLVVDDNEDAADMLSMMLEHQGYRTAVAHDGNEALKIAHTLAPDIVILDIGLPGLNGYDVAAQLRADADLFQPALIALTGWGSPDDRQRALAAGFDVHLTKPVSAADLHDALERAGRHERRAALG